MPKTQKASLKRNLKVALIQMHTTPKKVEKNLKLALKLAKIGVKKGAKLIIFPELFDSGYCVEGEEQKFASDFANTKDSKTLQTLLDFTKIYNIHIIGCVIESDSITNKYYDTAFIMNQNGIVGKYRKIYLWGSEVKRFERGLEYPIFELDFGEFKTKIGLQICYEIGFSEGARILSLKGAEVLIYPSAFGRARLYAWNLASRARALENGAFVLALNQSKFQISQFDGSKVEFCANSQIINPRGEVLKKAKNANDVLIQKLCLDDCAAQRAALPYLKDLNITLCSKALQSLDKGALKTT